MSSSCLNVALSLSYYHFLNIKGILKIAIGVEYSGYFVVDTITMVTLLLISL